MESREPVRVSAPVTEEILAAIQKFDQRFLDVIIPLVPRFEREVLEASNCFLLRHRRADHRSQKIDCESAQRPSLWKTQPICG